MFLLLWPCQTDAGRVRSVAGWIDRGTRILVVTAHPDDEVLLAPLLGRRCVTGGATCTLLVLTAGENGVCMRNCDGDLGKIRTEEMARAAALLNARLLQWNEPDSHSIASPALSRRIADVITTTKPDLILTFDPLHGSTCHPAHRQTAEMVLESGATNVVHLETVVTLIEDGVTLGNGAPGVASVYVANDSWEWTVRIAETHMTQFTPELIERLRTLPEAQRRIWLMRAGREATARCE